MRRGARRLPRAFGMPPMPPGRSIVRGLSVTANWPSRKKRRPGLGGDPVRVAAAGVEIGHLRGSAVLVAIAARSFLISNGPSVSYRRSVTASTFASLLGGAPPHTPASALRATARLARASSNAAGSVACGDPDAPRRSLAGRAVRGPLWGLGPDPTRSLPLSARRSRSVMAPPPDLQLRQRASERRIDGCDLFVGDLLARAAPRRAHALPPPWLRRCARPESPCR